MILSLKNGANQPYRRQQIADGVHRKTLPLTLPASECVTANHHRKANVNHPALINTDFERRFRLPGNRGCPDMF